MIVLRLVFLAQLLVMLSGWIILVATPVDFHTLALLALASLTVGAFALGVAMFNPG